MTKTKILILTLLFSTKLLFAQDPYLSEIRLFAGTFAPANWAFCDGSLLAISQYDALFSLIGTTYGGDGQSTFALPDLRGRVPVHIGTGPGLSNYPLGQSSGSETVTMTTANMPSHNHASQIKISDQRATTSVPTTSSSIAPSGIVSGRTYRPNASFNNQAPNTVVDNITTSSTGGNQPINIVKPFQTLNYIISLFGIYPSQN